MKTPRLLPLFALILSAVACTPAAMPAPVSQADAVADSKAAAEAKVYAPQAHATAEKLLAEAKWLHDEGRLDEASVAGEQAIAAYHEAFALARAAQAEERIDAARKAESEAAEALALLDRQQSQVAADADAYEMRARVHLDTEAVKDVDKLTPERAKVRRQAARQLSAEASLLCLATQMLDEKAQGLAAAQETIAQLEKELAVGSLKDDLYPRAAAGRAVCLEQLTHARRPAVKQAPESSASDRLFTSLTETGKVFAFRDDRGIVANIGSPLDAKGTLTADAQETLKVLGGTAKAHADFPVLLVVHTAKSGQEKRSAELGDAASAALKAGGAPQVSIRSVLNAQPVVASQIKGADEQNERVEVVFVVPGR